jgi:ribosomal protein S18 acetylase RimI-like enzyme
MNNRPDYRLLTHSDIERAADIMSQAFVDDPLYKFMLPFTKTRLRTLRKFFRVYGKVYINNQRGYGTGDPLEGVAFWTLPAQPAVVIRLRSPSILLPLLFTPFPIGYLRARPIRRKFFELQKLYDTEPHYYLNYIGVLSSSRGKGIASKLIRPFLEKADSENIPVYLDTSNRSNLALYHHFGFHCMEETTVANTGIIIWAMRRSVQGK